MSTKKKFALYYLKIVEYKNILIQVYTLTDPLPTLKIPYTIQIM